MKKIVALILLVLSSSHLAPQAQDRQFIDSLQNEIKKYDAHKKELGSKATPLMDSTKANLLYNIYTAYYKINSDSAMEYAEKHLQLSESIGYKKGIANGFEAIGTIYFYKSNYSIAIVYYEKAIKIMKEIGDSSSIAYSYNNIGASYGDLGNYPEALKGYMNSLKIREEIADKTGVAQCYNNIGDIYAMQGNYSLALKDFLQSLKIAIEIKNKYRIASAALNLGGIYVDLHNYPEALKNADTSLIIFEETNNKIGIGRSYFTIGDIYYHEGNYSDAIKNHLASVKIRDEIRDKNGLEQSYISLGLIYEKQNNLNEAIKYETNGLSLALEIGANDDIKGAYKNLAEINSKLGNYKAAYENENLFKQYYDTINNKENERKFMQYDFDKKQDSITSLQVKKDAVKENEIKNQKRIRNYTLGGFTIMFLAAGLFFFQRRTISKEKKRSDVLLLNILPEEVAEELKDTGKAKAKRFDEVTVMFTDFKSFTQISETLSPEELVAEIDFCFKGFDNIIHKYNIEKIKTIGDSYMAAGGLPVANKTHAKDVVSAAIEIVDFMEAHKQQRIKEDRPVFEIRIGINTGPVVAGIVGVKKFAYDIWGDTVNLASRMESSGEAGKINISGSTYELVKNDFTCTYRGKIQAKNKGEVDMYFIQGC